MMKKWFAFTMLISFVFAGCQSAREEAISGYSGKTDMDISKAVLHVKGRFLYNACGEMVIIRGIEEFQNNHIDEIARTAANAYRIVYSTKAGDLEKLLYKAIAENNMIVCLYHCGKEYNSVEWFNDPDIKAVLKNYESHLILHAHGEGTYDGFSDITTQRWIREAKEVIFKVRSYGYKCPLEIYSNSGGQNLAMLLKHGREVIESDPERNIILGCQMYSPYAFHYLNSPDITIEKAIQLIVQSGLPIQLGSCPFTDKDCQPMSGAHPDDWFRVWRGTFKNLIGCYYWCWSGSPPWLPACDALSNDGSYGSWTIYGEEICGNSRYSTTRTSVKGTCRLMNRPPVVMKQIKNLVLGTDVREYNDLVNLKEYFTDYEDGNSLKYSISVISKPRLLSAVIDKEGNLDLKIPKGSYGICRIDINAGDSGGKQTSQKFTVRICQPGRKNLALFRKSTASSVENEYADVKYANDGLENTRWASAWWDDQWVMIDLGEIRIINCFYLSWETAFGLMYEIQVSVDEKKWKTVYEEENGDGEIDEFTIKPVAARYVKMHGIKRATEWGFSLWEFAVYGKE